MSTPEVPPTDWVGLLDFSRLARLNPPFVRICLPSLKKHLGQLKIAPLSFQVHHGMCPCEHEGDQDWLATALDRALARIDNSSDLVVVGAECRDVERIRALRAQGRSIVAVNWPAAFDMELWQAVNWSVRLDSSLTRSLDQVETNLSLQDR